MTSEDGAVLGFAPPDDQPIQYLKRIRDYYSGLGYGAPYEWAHYSEVPFAPMAKPVGQATIGLVTTASPYDPANGDQGPGAPYNSAAKFYRVYTGETNRDHDLRISHIAIDRTHTTAEDSNTWFPLPTLRRFVAEGRIGRLAPRFYGAPTNRSQRTTIEQDAEEILAMAREDRVDGMLLVAN